MKKIYKKLFNKLRSPQNPPRYLRGIEEVFPFSNFLLNSCIKHKTIKSIENNPNNYKEYQKYSNINIDNLDKRLNEEWDRASAIDQKTFKFTLSVSIALTVLGSASTLLDDQVDGCYPKILLILSIVYFLISGLIALGSIKTLPKYGYGTESLLRSGDQLQEYKASSLILMEEINIIRHIRNEAAYQTLRNGFILFILSSFTYGICLLKQ
ncbi:MAG: hypothetical protein OXF84_05885 [Bacteroidetes bacterium]|nr:hypothetical protein [Bacteroidota bacterium]